MKTKYLNFFGIPYKNMRRNLTHKYSLGTQRMESLKFKTESVLKKYLIVPAYLNCRNDLNVVLNFSVSTFG